MLRPYTARSIRRTPEHGHADLRAELLQLLAGGGAREVRRHKSRSLLLELQPPRELRRGGGLPRALQPDQQDHRRRAAWGAPRCAPTVRDRKSTRLNSSHRTISYAVFCLKKKSDA